MWLIHIHHTYALTAATPLRIKYKVYVRICIQMRSKGTNNQYMLVRLMEAMCENCKIIELRTTSTRLVFSARPPGSLTLVSCAAFSLRCPFLVYSRWLLITTPIIIIQIATTNSPVYYYLHFTFAKIRIPFINYLPRILF